MRFSRRLMYAALILGVMGAIITARRSPGGGDRRFSDRSLAPAGGALLPQVPQLHPIPSREGQHTALSDSPANVARPNRSWTTRIETPPAPTSTEQQPDAPATYLEPDLSRAEVGPQLDHAER